MATLTNSSSALDASQRRGSAAAANESLDTRVAPLDTKPLKADFVRLLGRTAANFGSSVFALGVYSDAKKPVSTLYLGQGGLGMPDRDYYLTDGFKDKRA